MLVGAGLAKRRRTARGHGACLPRVLRPLDRRGSPRFGAGALLPGRWCGPAPGGSGWSTGFWRPGSSPTSPSIAIPRPRPSSSSAPSHARCASIQPARPWKNTKPRWSAVLQRYGVDSVSQLPVSYAGISLDASERWASGSPRPELLHQDTFAARRRSGPSAAAIFPFLALRNASQSLAGTDLQPHRAFTEAAEGYRRDLIRIMNAEMTDHAVGQDFAYRSDPAAWAKVPPFEFESPSLVATLAHQRANLGILGGWLAGVAVAAFGVTRRAVP
ncbi:MAG: DUF3526 domain-containing protein [Gemmatimonadales bacterium]